MKGKLLLFTAGSNGIIWSGLKIDDMIWRKGCDFISGLELWENIGREKGWGVGRRYEWMGVMMERGRLAWDSLA